jgi:hypothetical protein
VRDPPQLGIDSLDLLDMSLGPQPVLGVRRYGPRLAFLGSAVRSSSRRAIGTCSGP